MLQAPLEVEMAKECERFQQYTTYTYRKEKTTAKRTASKVIKRPNVIGNIKEIEANKVIKRPKVIGNTEEPKANRVIKTPKEVKVDDKHKRYVNLRSTTC